MVTHTPELSKMQVRAFFVHIMKLWKHLCNFQFDLEMLYVQRNIMQEGWVILSDYK